MEKLRIAILGSTGMVGQQFIARLHDHPWFSIACLAASPRSAGRSYAEAVAGRWEHPVSIPESIAQIPVFDVGDIEQIAAQVDFAFCPLSTVYGQGHHPRD
jgi:aspartate-semialdehyde dehydrogenase